MICFRILPNLARQRGFSLIELLAALAIAAILLFIAIPGYQGVILKSNRAAARGVLIGVMSRQEQYFVNNKDYSTRLGSLGLPEPYYIDRQAAPVAASAAIYRIELNIADNAFDGVTAIPVNGQTNDRPCLAFAINRLGVRSVTGARSGRPADCW